MKRYSKPVKIKRLEGNLLYSEWSDGFKATIKLEALRKNCPCADCKKEELSKKPKIGVTKLQQFTPGMNELKSLQKVGNYAVTAVWGDGHDSGIYTWEVLRAIFEENKIEI